MHPTARLQDIDGKPLDLDADGARRAHLEALRSDVVSHVGDVS